MRDRQEPQKLTMIPFLIVPETRAPTRTAPKNSQRAAAMHACFNVSERDATDVAKDCWGEITNLLQ